MPAYFSMTIHFEHKRIEPDFVREIYSQIMSNGFGFKSGFWFHRDANLDEIIKWNQKLLEKGFKLGFTQHVKHDYMQILFLTNHYSELRGYWHYSDKEVTFSLIVPEGDILNCEGGSFFLKDKVMPLKKLAIKLWEQGMVDAIQTNVELEDGSYALSDILSGKDISANPYAILSEKAYKKFSTDYFKQMKLNKIKNNGVIIETDGTIELNF